MANGTPEEPINDDLLTREGAINILREIRQDLRTAGALNNGLKLPDHVQIDYLNKAVDGLVGQVFALSAIVARLLDDPLIEMEIHSDLEET